MLNTRKIGSIGVSAAVYYYTSMGYQVSLPLSDTQRYDLVVDKEGVLYRVEVKTSSYKAKSGRYQFLLKTTGGNKSWSGVVSTISSDDCDLAFLYALDGSIWEFNSSELEGMSTKNPDPDKRLLHPLAGYE